MGNNKGNTNLNRATQHKWSKLSSSQSRCLYCNIIRTASTTKHVNTTTYQLTDTSIVTEYVECTGKPNNSEFY